MQMMQSRTSCFGHQLECFSECRLFSGRTAPRKINSDDSNLGEKIVHVETFSSTCPQHFSNTNFALWMKKKRKKKPDSVSGSSAVAAVSAKGLKKAAFQGVKKRQRFLFQHKHDHTTHAGFITDTISHTELN